jgi:hypothetical protein
MMDGKLYLMIISCIFQMDEITFQQNTEEVISQEQFSIMELILTSCDFRLELAWAQNVCLDFSFLN